MQHIFLHGLGQTADSWRAVLSGLSDQTEIQCPNLPDFLADGSCRYQQLYEAFSRYCLQKDESLFFCGLSLGAVLALHFAMDHPENTAALVLIAPQYHMPKHLLHIQNLIFRFLPEKQFTDTGFRKQDFMTLTASMAELDFTDRLVNVTCPAKILCGERDSVNQKAAIRLSKALPNASYEIIKNAGHEVNLDQPLALAQAIIAFDQTFS